MTERHNIATQQADYRAALMTSILYNVHKADGQPSRSPEDLFPSLKVEPEQRPAKKQQSKKSGEMSGQQIMLHLMNNGFVPDRERNR